MNTRIIRTDDPRELLASVPYQLGFHPSHCVVVLGLSGPRSRLTVLARADLESIGDPRAGPAVARHLLDRMAREDVRAVVTVVYAPESDLGPGEGRERVRRAAGTMLHLSETIVGAGECWLVTDRQYMDLACTDPDCPAVHEGPVSDLQSTRMGAEMVLAGYAPVADRQTLSRLPSLSPTRRRAAQRAWLREWQRRPAAEGDRLPWRLEQIARWRAALGPPPPGPEAGGGPGGSSARQDADPPGAAAPGDTRPAGRDRAAGEGGPLDGGPAEGGSASGGSVEGGPTDAGPVDGAAQSGGPVEGAPAGGGPASDGQADGGGSDGQGADAPGLDDLSPTEVGRLGAGLADIRVRDAVMMLLVPGCGPGPERSVGLRLGAPTGEAPEKVLDTVCEPGSPVRPHSDFHDRAGGLLVHVAAHAAHGRRAPALTVGAWLAWWQGAGARAGALVEAALREDPDLSLAHLVDQVLQAGLPPGWAAHVPQDRPGDPE